MNQLETEPLLYTVSDLTRLIRSALEGNPLLTNVWVKGEISNLTLHSTGHIYFTLKDEGSVLAAVFFRNANRNLKFKLEEGMSVFACGSVTVYDKRGSYQLLVNQVKLEGLGELQRRIELLKKKLLAEGLFDRARKKPIPFLPRRIGVVTSPTGAAIRDIIKVALRRFPNVEIVVAPCKVQGDDAAGTIVRAIQELNRPEHAIDVIIAGRGGGSFEDLMPFNEEQVVRAFAGSRVPIISAVGHQVDHPLSDDAADLAVPTPSAAAEQAVPMKRELQDEIGYLLNRSSNAVASLVRHTRTRLDGVVGRRIFTQPREIVDMRELRLADVETRLLSSIKERVMNGRRRLMTIPDITMLVRDIVKNKNHAHAMAVSTLEQLSPLGVLRRGYSITMNGSGALVRSVASVAVGEKITVRLADGVLGCTVDARKKGGVFGKEEDGENS